MKRTLGSMQTTLQGTSTQGRTKTCPAVHVGPLMPKAPCGGEVVKGQIKFDPEKPKKKNIGEWYYRCTNYQECNGGFVMAKVWDKDPNHPPLPCKPKVRFHENWKWAMETVNDQFSEEEGAEIMKTILAYIQQQAEPDGEGGEVRETQQVDESLG